MRLSGTKATAIHQYRGLGNQLWDLAGNRPSLDLRFADSKSLVDATTGTNLIDFTRASSGTYVGSDGLIKTATTNYLLQSEDFSTTWTLSFYTLITGFISPTGSATATKLVRDSTSSGGSGVLQNVTVNSSTEYTYSLFAKAGEYSKISIREGVSTGAYLSVDLSNGTEIDSNKISAPSIIDAGNGWYRISFALTTESSQTSFGCRIYALPDSYTSGSPLFAWAGNDVDGIYIWGAQLEQSSTVGEYVKTTSTINSAPRFDHDPTTGESLGLLVEESRANLIAPSVPDDGTSWNVGINVSATTDNDVAPDGTSSATYYQITGGPSSQFVSYDATVAASTTYTFSFYVKNDNASDLKYSALDLIATADIVPSTSYLSQVNTDSYTRISFSFTTPVGCTSARVFISRPFGETGAFYAWGAQLEEGSFPTSYIPTEGSAVTRAADVASISGNNFGTFNLLQYSEEFDQAEWSKGANTTITPNYAAAPNGTLSAYRLQMAAGVGTFLTQATTLTNGLTYTLSVYARATTGTSQITLAQTGTNIQTFPLTTSWQRISVTFTASSSTFVGFDNSNIAIDVLIWGAQLEQSPVATAYVKSNVTWQSRASRATYYDENGVVRTIPANLLLRSEEFDTPSTWATNGALAFGSGSIANAATAPDGTITADKLVETAGGSLHFINQTVTVVAATVYTLSVYVKAAERNRVGLYFGGSGGSSQGIIVNLQNGTFAENLINAPASYSIAPASNGWYRISITTTATGTAANHSVYICNDSNAFSYSGDGTSGIYLWGAQLEESPTVSEYIPTTTAIASLPRNNAYLPDGNGNFVSAGDVLLEKASTNLLLRSEEFDQSPWITNFANPTANAVTAPNGEQTADLLISTTSAAYSRAWQSILTSGSTVTASCYLRSDIPFTGSLRLRKDGAEVTVKNVNIGTSWERFDITDASVFSSSCELHIFLNSNGLSGTSVSGRLLYLWGAQLEAGSFPTSYIQTTGTERTRAADVSTSSSGFGNSWYRQSEGTVFTEANTFFTGSIGREWWRVSDGTSNNLMRLSRSGSGATPQFIVTAAGNGQGGPYSPNVVANIFFKNACYFKTDDLGITTNGSLLTGAAVDTLATIPTGINRLDLSTSIINGHYKRLTFWPQRLPNETLQGITQE